MGNNIYKYTCDAKYNCCLFTNNGTKLCDDQDIPYLNAMFNGSWTEVKTQETTASTAPTDTTAPTDPVPAVRILLGDANQDKKISVKDVTAIQRYLADMELLSGDALTAADVNKDGTVSIKDATYVQLFLVEKEVEGNYAGTYVEQTQPTQPTQPTTQPTQPTQPTTQPTTAPSGTVLNLKPGMWNQANARFAIYCFNNSTGTNAWVDMSGSGETYSATLPAGTWEAVIFVRMNGATTENNWKNKWNQTADLTDFANGKTYVITGWDKSGNWQ